MSHYEIHVTCTECGGEHPMRVRINLEDGPPSKRSVSDAYPDKRTRHSYSQSRGTTSCA